MESKAPSANGTTGLGCTKANTIEANKIAIEALNLFLKARYKNPRWNISSPIGIAKLMGMSNRISSNDDRDL